MHIPKLTQLSVTAQISFLGMIVLLVWVFFSVNRAIMHQELRSNASTIYPTFTPLATPSVTPKPQLDK